MLLGTATTILDPLSTFRTVHSKEISFEIPFGCSKSRDNELRGANIASWAFVVKMAKLGVIAKDIALVAIVRVSSLLVDT